MPVFTDYNNLSSYSSAYYYSPYSLSSRMSNALYSSNPLGAPSTLYSSASSTSLAGPSTSLTPTRGYYYPARPIAIDMANIDVSSAQLPLRKTNNTTAAYGTIHRGRTVIRLKMSNLKDNPGIFRQKSPGRRLVEKFTIPDKSKTFEPVKIASSAPIRRHISTNRRKASLITDEGTPVPASRKSSVTDELLKEEAAIFDSLIMEEIARTNGIPDRRNSCGCIQPEVKSRKKGKRHSVDFSEMNGVQCSESLNDFIEKLNASVARSPSVEDAVPKVSLTAADEKEKKHLVINADVSVEEDNNLGKKINYDVIIEESPEPPPEASFTFVFKKPDKKHEAKDDTNNAGKKVKLKKNASETLSDQITTNKKVLNDSEPETKKIAKPEPKKSDDVPKVPTSKIELVKSKTAPSIAPQPVQRKHPDTPKYPQKIELNKSSSVALISDVSSEVAIEPPKPIRIIELSKSNKALLDSTEPVPEVIRIEQAKTKVLATERTKLSAPEALKKNLEKSPKSTLKNELAKSSTDIAVAKISPSKSKAQATKTNNIAKPAKKAEPGVEKTLKVSKTKNSAEKSKKETTSTKVAVQPKTNSKENSTEVIKIKKKSTVKKISKKSTKKSIGAIDKNNNEVSVNLEILITNGENINGNGSTATSPDESLPVSPRRRRSINWKLVDVGESDFGDEITEINGWFPEEESDDEYSSDEDSDEETDSDEDSDGMWCLPSYLLGLIAFCLLLTAEKN